MSSTPSGHKNVQMSGDKFPIFLKSGQAVYSEGQSSEKREHKLTKEKLSERKFFFAK
jgi:hypothetical protein